MIEIKKIMVCTYHWDCAQQLCVLISCDFWSGHNLLQREPFEKWQRSYTHDVLLTWLPKYDLNEKDTIRNGDSSQGLSLRQRTVATKECCVWKKWLS